MIKRSKNTKDILKNTKDIFYHRKLTIKVLG